MKKRINSYLLMLAGMSIGGIAGAAIEFRLTQKQINHWKNMSNKHLKLMILLNQWFATKQEKKSIDAYFHKNKIENIAYLDKAKLSKQQKEEFNNLGEELIRKGEYAVVTMAGGQGTRLGHNGPKGTFKLDVYGKGKYLFEILAENLKEANKK